MQCSEWACLKAKNGGTSKNHLEREMKKFPLQTMTRDGVCWEMQKKRAMMEMCESAICAEENSFIVELFPYETCGSYQRFCPSLFAAMNF